jgi:hypothetical protein
LKYAKNAMRKEFEINNKSDPKNKRIVLSFNDTGYAIINPENKPKSCNPLQPLFISTALDPTIEIILLSVVMRNPKNLRKLAPRDTPARLRNVSNLPSGKI